MRNYLFSIAVHLILFLLLLGLSSVTTIKNQPEEFQSVIMVDFSESKETIEEPKKTSKEVKNVAKKVSPPKKKPTAAKREKPIKKKAIDKKPLQTSQKPRAERVKVLQDESEIVKKVIPVSKPEPTAEEIAALEKEKRKAEKRSEFSSLLARAKKKTAADQDRPENGEEVSDSNIGTSPTPNSSSKNRNIQGVLGHRKVLRVPTIKDNSQKKGRVVVKICVAASGKVISSKYTMLGSTTSDIHLIGLAEKGALDYLFSPSENQRECGNVTIEFQLK